LESRPIELPEKLIWLLTEKWRYKIVRGGRGSAKSRTIATALILRGAKEPIRWLCARDSQKALKYSSKQILVDEINRLGLQAHYTVVEDEIRGNVVDESGRRTIFIFSGIKEMGADALKSLEDFDGCWIAEAHNVTKASWEKLTPTFRKQGSEIWVDYNPELEADHVHRFAETSVPDDGVKVVHVNYYDNPWFEETSLKQDMERLKRTDFEAYEHVWLGKPKSAADGAIFAEEMRAVDADNRICAVPYDRTKPVHVICDMGFRDLFSMVFCQTYGGWLNFIDFYENNKQPMSHYAMVARNRGYVLGNLFLPHDAANNHTHRRLAGASDLSTSIPDTLRDLGFNVRLVPALLKEDKRVAARNKFPVCRFDAEKCADLIRHLRYYQWDKEPGETGRVQPLHDDHSHAADAFQDACVAVKETPIQEIKPRPRLPERTWTGVAI
jgi:phage terminase large subunit